MAVKILTFFTVYSHRRLSKKSLRTCMLQRLFFIVSDTFKNLVSVLEDIRHQLAAAEISRILYVFSSSFTVNESVSPTL